MIYRIIIQTTLMYVTERKKARKISESSRKEDNKNNSRAKETKWNRNRTNNELLRE